MRTQQDFTNIIWTYLDLPVVCRSTLHDFGGTGRQFKGDMDRGHRIFKLFLVKGQTSILPKSCAHVAVRRERDIMCYFKGIWAVEDLDANNLLSRLSSTSPAI